MRAAIGVLSLIFLVLPNFSSAGSLDFPWTAHGLSFGNSLNFTGGRFNLADDDVGTINGLNFTFLGHSLDPEYSARTINGVALGWEPTADVHNGFSLAGYQVTSNAVNGLALGLLGVETHRAVQGVAIGGFYVGGDESSITGLAVAALWTGGRYSELEGISVGGINTTQKTTGLQVGLFNRTQELNGIQIGLLNYAANNPAGLRLLPGLNAHISF